MTIFSIIIKLLVFSFMCDDHIKVQCVTLKGIYWHKMEKNASEGF